MEGGIFLTVKDLMKLTGSENYNSTGNYHRQIRDTRFGSKKKITIKEYCEAEKIEFNYVWQVLRSVSNK